jgi:multidrug efflux pump subunit AcrA (membrane-fusion protein)
VPSERVCRSTRLLLSLVAAATLVACKASSAGRESTPRGGGAEVREVEVVPATADRLVRAITVTGTLAAEEQVTLSMKVTGRLQELHVDLGSRVRQGQVLARLAPTDFNLRVSQAEAACRCRARTPVSIPNRPPSCGRRARCWRSPGSTTSE